MRFLVQLFTFLLIALGPTGAAFSAGALAIDSNKGDQWGWAIDHKTIDAAEKRALKECGQGCRIVARFRDGCLAYAADRSVWGDAWGWGAANTEALAKSKANQECTKNGGFDCITRVWGCDQVTETDSPKKSKPPQSNQVPAPSTHRVFFNDGRRCSAWCPEATREVQGLCARQGMTASIQNCQCNETKAPNFADVKYSCQGPTTSRGDINTSLVMLIDTSGSMAGKKLSSAKQAAIESVQRSLRQGVEIAVLAFSGGCSSPIARQQIFTRDEAKLVSFINSLKASGGTPLASALLEVNSYLDRAKAPNSATQMVLLLADGDNSCGNVASVIDQLKGSNTLFRHEAVGLEIESGSKADTELKSVARASGGNYHFAASSSQLSQVFKDAIETMELLNMLGGFGGEPSKTTKPEKQKVEKQTPSNKASNLWEKLE